MSSPTSLWGAQGCLCDLTLSADGWLISQKQLQQRWDTGSLSHAWDLRGDCDSIRRGWPRAVGAPTHSWGELWLGCDFSEWLPEVRERAGHTPVPPAVGILISEASVPTPRPPGGFCVHLPRWLFARFSR